MIGQPLDRIIARLEGPLERFTLETWRGLCPVHGGAGFTVSLNSAGVARLRCRRHCQPHELLTALGLRAQDLIPSRPAPPPAIVRPLEILQPHAPSAYCVWFAAHFVYEHPGLLRPSSADHWRHGMRCDVAAAVGELNLIAGTIEAAIRRCLIIALRGEAARAEDLAGGCRALAELGALCLDPGEIELEDLEHADRLTRKFSHLRKMLQMFPAVQTAAGSTISRGGIP